MKDKLSKLRCDQRGKHSPEHEYCCAVASDIVEAAIDEMGEEAFLQWVYDHVGDNTERYDDTNGYYVRFYVPQLTDFELSAQGDQSDESVSFHCLDTLGLDPAYVVCDTDIELIAAETMNALIYMIVEESDLLAPMEEDACVSGWTHQKAYETLCTIADTASEQITSSLFDEKEQLVANKAISAFKEFIDSYEDSVYLLRLLSDWTEWNTGYAITPDESNLGDYIMGFTNSCLVTVFPISEVFNVYGIAPATVEDMVKNVGELISHTARDYDYGWGQIDFDYWCDIPYIKWNER